MEPGADTLMKTALALLSLAGAGLLVFLWTNREELTQDYDAHRIMHEHFATV
jgi:hypothetical protein